MVNLNNPEYRLKSHRQLIDIIEVKDTQIATGQQVAINLSEQLKQKGQDNIIMREALEEISKYMQKGCKGKQTDKDFITDCFFKGFCTNQCACFMMQHAESALQKIIKAESEI